jgi:hypothetical protein
MTRQQIKDYEKVQSVVLLKMWIDAGNPDSVKDEELEKLTIRYAISDIDSLLDNTQAELQCTYDEEDRKMLLTKARKAKWFLRKYA